MTADVNVTEKVADAIYDAAFGQRLPESAEHFANAALSVLSDPEVLAGMVGVLREHAIDGSKSWGRVYCACGWVAHEVGTPSRDEHYEHQAIALADWLGGQGVAAESKVAQVNRLLGVNLWDAPSFRADVRIDFHEDGSIYGATLLNPAAVRPTGQEQADG